MSKKKTGWEIAMFPKMTLITNWYESLCQAYATFSKAKDIASNEYILGHRLLTRMTLTAPGKVAKICKVNLKNYLTKGY